MAEDTPDNEALKNPQEAKPGHLLEHTEHNLQLLDKIYRRGLTPPSESEIDIFPSATTSPRTEVIYGNIYDPEVKGTYDPETKTFQLREENTGRVISKEGPNEEGILSGENYFRAWEAYLRGDNTPAAMGAKERAEGWRGRLYEGPSAVFPVMAERPWIHPPRFLNEHDEGNLYYQYLSPQDCEERINNSILAVVKWENIRNDSIRGEMLNYLSVAAFEYKAVEPIPFEKIEMLIVPENLESLTRKVFPEDVVKKKIRFVPTVTKKISVYKWSEKPMRVPDYESALRNLGENNPNQAYWLHGVRLKTERDIGQQKAWQEHQEEQKARNTLREKLK